MLPVLVVAHRRVTLVEPMTAVLARHPDLAVTVVVDGPGSRSDQTLVDEVAERFRDELSGRRAKVVVRGHNLGVGASLPAACGQFFEEHESGVVLEDDCIPTVEFLEYSRTLLERFSHDYRIGSLSGTSLRGRNLWDAAVPLHLSRFPLIWGWATWADRWSNFQLDLSNWRMNLSFRKLVRMGGVAHAIDWARLFNSVSTTSPWAWDYQWVYALWANQQLAVHPGIDLVENIGFGPLAVNTVTRPAYAPQVPSREIRQRFLEDVVAAQRPLVLDKSGDRALRHLLWSPPIRERLVRHLSKARQRPKDGAHA